MRCGIRLVSWAVNARSQERESGDRKKSLGERRVRVGDNFSIANTIDDQPDVCLVL